jgi:hypothetical protein
MDGDGYELTWEQVRMGTEQLDRWTVRVTEPHVSEVFASVSKAALRPGVWLVRFTPRGSDLHGPCVFSDYLSREKAVAHVEHWARYHWQHVPVWKHQGGTSARCT